MGHLQRQSDHYFVGSFILNTMKLHVPHVSNGLDIPVGPSTTSREIRHRSLGKCSGARLFILVPLLLFVLLLFFITSFFLYSISGHCKTVIYLNVYPI